MSWCENAFLRSSGWRRCLAWFSAERLVADTTTGSPNVDNVYITWTVFKRVYGGGAAKK